MLRTRKKGEATDYVSQEAAGERRTRDGVGAGSRVESVDRTRGWPMHLYARQTPATARAASTALAGAAWHARLREIR